MQRKTHKFLPVKDGQFGQTMTLEQLMSCKEDFDTYLQYTGFEDADKNEVYEGAVLELRITDELMDSSKNTFYNSNLGKAMSKDRSIKSVICVLADDNETLQCRYDVYFMRDDGIEFEDGEPDSQAVGHDTLFPTYICNKGAVIIGNIAITKDILKNISNYSKWKAGE